MSHTKKSRKKEISVSLLTIIVTFRKITNTNSLWCQVSALLKSNVDKNTLSMKTMKSN